MSLSLTKLPLQSTTVTPVQVASNESQSQRPDQTSAGIYNLDDDSLLEIFRLYLVDCRRIVTDEDDHESTLVVLNPGEWGHKGWWRQLTQVCRRWRHLALDSAQHLRLTLVCDPSTPIAKMLAYSAPLPLIIDSRGRTNGNTNYEEGIILALQRRDHVRCIRLGSLIQDMQKVIAALDGEYPILESLVIEFLAPKGVGRTDLPESLKAPRLRHLKLSGFALPLPISSPLLTTATGLVTLTLVWYPRPDHFCPNHLIQLLSHLPQLETLWIITYRFLREIEILLLETPVMTRVTFPNLRRFGFQGSSALLEEILPWMATPLLENFKVWFHQDQLTFPLPHLPQFLSAAEKLKFAGGSATLELGDGYVLLRLHPSLLTGKETGIYPSTIGLSRQRPGLVESSAQLFMLGSIFSAVEHVTLKYEAYEGSKVHYKNGDLTQWRNLLTSLRNVKTLRVGPLLVNELSRILQAVEELPVKILPGLRELSFPRSDNDGAFTTFAEARRIAGWPITLVDTDH